MYYKENKYNEIGKDVYEVLILLLCGVFSVCCFFFEGRLKWVYVRGIIYID